jgi:hypothetical protein
MVVEYFGMYVCPMKKERKETGGRTTLTVCDSSRTDGATITIQARLVGHDDDFDIIAHHRVC